MDRLLEALMRLSDEPAPPAVEPLSEGELHEFERLAPQSRQRAELFSSPVACLQETSRFYSQDEIVLEAGLQELDLAQVACDPWASTEIVDADDPVEIWESTSAELENDPWTDSPEESEEIDFADESVSSEPEELEESREYLPQEETELPIATEAGILDEATDRIEEYQEATIDAPQEAAPEVAIQDETTPQEEVSPALTQPNPGWAEQPYLELLHQISERHALSVSRAFALASIDELPDREIAVTGLAKAYAFTSGGRALIVSAASRSPRLVEQLGVNSHSGKAGTEELALAEFEHVQPTRHERTDFLNLESLFPSGEEQPYAAIDPTLVSRWRARYSLILLDTGPWGGPLLFPLARQCDATYVFLGLGVTRRERALDAITRMKRGGIFVAGCVLTGSRSGELL